MLSEYRGSKLLEIQSFLLENTAEKIKDQDYKILSEAVSEEAWDLVDFIVFEAIEVGKKDKKHKTLAKNAITKSLRNLVASQQTDLWKIHNLIEVASNHLPHFIDGELGSLKVLAMDRPDALTWLKVCYDPNSINDDDKKGVFLRDVYNRLINDDDLGRKKFLSRSVIIFMIENFPKLQDKASFISALPDFGMKLVNQNDTIINLDISFLLQEKLCPSEIRGLNKFESKKANQIIGNRSLNFVDRLTAMRREESFITK